MSGAWGSGSWGSGSWGGGGGMPGDGIVAFLESVAIRENAVRIEFDDPVNFTRLLDMKDSSRIENWSMSPVLATTGMNGEVARPVSVVGVELAGTDDGVGPRDAGRFVKLILDRPMTPWPAQYRVAWTNIFISGGGGSPQAGNSIFEAAYRVLQAPSIEAPQPSRDFANPQTLADALDSLPNPTAAISLGTFGMAGDGDYALDEGVRSLKKRCIRRVFTIKNAFAHLPGYGIGLQTRAKRLGSPLVISELQRDAEAEIRREPDVQAVKAVVTAEADSPNIGRLRLAVRPKAGPAFAFEVPFEVR